MEYAFEHDGKAYTPSGVVEALQDVSAYNAGLEAKELENIKTGPDKLFLYVGHKPLAGRETYCVQTWLGTWLGWCWLGPQSRMGFGFHSYRQPITVRIFGTLYHGWYFTSSGEYCRLRKAKIQHGNAARYAATVVNS